jgi:hypothetical protein
MRGSSRVSNLNQKFVVQEIIRYHSYWKKDDLYQDKLKAWYKEKVKEGTDPYCGAYREALRQLGDG